MPNLSPQEFVAKWRSVTANESKVAQSHFNELCRLIGQPSPLEADPSGEWFTFEAGATKQSGGQGWADVWKKGYFAWEYKGKHANLEKAYDQLLQYREALENPPLLVVSDIERIEIHTNFTNTAKRVITLTLDDLLTRQGLDQLKAVFDNPNYLKSSQTPTLVTQKAAEEFARLAQILRDWGVEPQPAAHFLIRILFCLFAEDVGLLPNRLFSRMVTKTWMRPADLAQQLKELFQKMATGGWFGAEEIPHFNGGLFNDDAVFDLDSDSLNILAKVSQLDWSSIEPSIIGTLFERGLDPSKRSQIGAHFTSKEDILLIVEPVLMAPLRGRWQEVKAQANDIAARRDALRVKDKTKRTRLHTELRVLLMNFSAEIARVQVLDPACGSGNFLYVALRQLVDLEKEVITLAAKLGIGYFQPTVNPAQVHGIEINPYAHELAHATVWIGYIQWLRENGFGTPSPPILKPLDNISLMDAILACDEQGKPKEPEWPAVDVIIGNPPFLGGNKIRQGLGDEYVEALFELYDGRVPATADLVCYWFEKARAMIEARRARRAGLLATQAIRGGANRKVLEGVKRTGDIFWAQSDRNWILDGATVHVSMVGFDAGNEPQRVLNGEPVSSINPNLTSETNVTRALPLLENKKVCFIGTKKAGAFDVDEKFAQALLKAKGNPNRRPNRDVVFRWVNGEGIVGRLPERWIIYFGEMAEAQASGYEKPFEYVKKEIYPKRQRNNEERARVKWWQPRRPATEMREAVASLSRYIATPRVSKHRIFSWFPPEVIPDDGVYIFARDDDYFFGVLHSKVHELWARATGTQLREAESGFRYTPTTTFETYPLPWPPGKEPKRDPRVKAIAAAARDLVKQRDAWLNPPGASEADLKARTLTNLYNERPTWLGLAHKLLDEAVLDAYGWPHEISDDEILARLLALDLERAGKSAEPETKTKVTKRSAHRVGG